MISNEKRNKNAPKDFDKSSLVFFQKNRVEIRHPKQGISLQHSPTYCFMISMGNVSLGRELGIIWEKSIYSF